MADLRSSIFGQVDNNLTGVEQAELAATALNPITRAYLAGRHGTEANYNLARESGLRAEATPEAIAEADALRAKTEGLRKLQGAYANRVQRVEDINGVGDALNWAGGQIGQGFASMQDPIAASALATGAGTAVSILPGPIPKLVGAGLRNVVAPALTYGIGRQQLKGEFYGDVSQDPTVMAEQSPQTIDRMGSRYGTLAAIPDSILPSIVGRQLGGAGLRAGLSKLPMGIKLGGEIGGEGLTELGQETGKQYAHGLLNPDRDTSGDASANLNSLLGGMVGAGAPVAVGGMADAGFRRVGAAAGGAANLVKEKAGQVVNLAQPYVDAAGQAISGAVDQAKAKAGDVINLAQDAADGVSVQGLKDKLKATSQELKSQWQATQEERALIAGDPPADIQNSTDANAWQLWMEENEPLRVRAIMDRLEGLADAQDPQALDFLERIDVDDSVAQQQAVEEAADYLLSRNEFAQLERQASRFGEAATKAGKAIGKAGVWAARKAASAGKSFGRAVWDGVQEGRKNAQDWTSGEADAEFQQRKQMAEEAVKNAIRMGEYLHESARVAEQRRGRKPGPIAKLMRDLGYEIAEMADLAAVDPQQARPDLRPQRGYSLGAGSRTYALGVNRIVNSLRSAYGAQTEQVLGNLRQMASPSAAPVFDAMDQELAAQRADKSGSRTVAIRADAAAQLMQAVDAETETRLLKDGINLRAPESQRQLLGMVEAISLGRAEPQARHALEKLVGRKALNQMLMAVAPQSELEGEGGTRATIGEDADQGDVAVEGFKVNDDGEVEEDATSVYDQEAAEKMVAQGEGSRMYGFFGTKNFRTDLDGSDPFAATSGMTRDEYAAFQRDNQNRQAMGEDPLPDPRRRPRLFTKDQMLSDAAGGGSAIEARIRQLEQYLKVDRTPERMAEMMEQEGKKAQAQRVRELIAQGDDSAKETLENVMKSFFINRAGSWRVGREIKEVVDGKTVTRREGTPVWDVLKRQNAQPTRILALFRDYLRQDGDPERAEIANKVMLDEMGQNGGEVRNFRVQAGMRKKVKAAAQKYFSERQIVEAGRLSNRDPEKLDETEILQMHKEGQKIVDLARKDGGHKLVSGANILTFESDLSPNGKQLHIKVSDLVKLAQDRRNRMTASDVEDTSGNFSNAAKNQKYLDLVLEGVGMVMDTGRVNGWPYKLNEYGKKEYLGDTSKSKNGVPPSLMLATMTNREWLFGRDKKAEANAGERVDPIAGPRDPRSVEDARSRMDDANPADVRKTLGGDVLIPDSRIEQEPSGYKNGYAIFDDLNSERGYQRNAGPALSNMRKANRTDVRPHEALTDSYSKTPLDVRRKPEGGKSMTGAPDEYADQRARSLATGYNAAAISGPAERKSDAVARAGQRAASIVQELKNDFDSGLRMIRDRLRTAEMPARTDDKGAAVGGSHYAAPLAHALSADTLSALDLGPAEAQQLQALRLRVARVLRDGDFSQRDRVELTRTMADPAVAEKITAPNVKAYLTKVLTRQDPTDAATPLPRGEPAIGMTRAQRNAASDAALSEYQAKQTARAKEAGASLGKSRFAPSGETDWSDSGRRLNRQSQEIHEELGRPGFAATHDSPHKFDGKFNWREHARKGEGAMAFGAGTYLSTADGVHKSYKDSFSAMVSDAITVDGEPITTPWRKSAKYSSLTEAESLVFRAMHNNPSLSTGEAIKAASLAIGDYSLADLRADLDMDIHALGNYMDDHVLNDLKSDIERTKIVDEKTGRVLGFDTKRLRHVLSQSDNSMFFEQSLRSLAHFENKDALVGEIEALDPRRFVRPAASKSPTYQVSVDIAPEQLLDWDKPLVEQSAPVRAALVQAVKDTELFKATERKLQVQQSLGARGYRSMGATWTFGTDGTITVVSGFESDAPVARYTNLDDAILGTISGADAYAALSKELGSDAKASDYLQSIGILGHKYAADGGRNDTHPNYVIYDDSKIHTNYVHFNAQDKRAGGQKESTWQERAQAIAEIRNTLGNDVKVEFAKLTGYSGEFIDIDNLIRISTTPAAGTLQTAYHEALHAFFKKFVKHNPLALDVLKSLAEHRPTLERVHALLDGHPAAQADLAAHGEERLAYIYQFWRAGLLDIPYGKPRTLFQKVLKFFRQVLGRVSDLERSADLLEAFARGDLASEPSAAGKVIAKHLMQGTWTRRQLRKMDGLMQTLGGLVITSDSQLGDSPSATARSLQPMFWTNPGEGSQGLSDEGYLNARHRMANVFSNQFALLTRELSDADLRAVTKALQREDGDLSDLAYPPARRAAEGIRSLLQAFRRYMVDERGLQIGDRGPNFFPRAWDSGLLMERAQEFIDTMTTQYADMLYGNSALEKQESARRLLVQLATNGMLDDKRPVSREDGVLTPYFAAGQQRVLAWMNGADIVKFQSQDITHILTTYFHNGVHAAEYAARFGAKGEKLAKMLQTIDLELMQEGRRLQMRGEFKDAAARDKWVERQSGLVRKAIDAMEGSIGENGNMGLRKLNSLMVVYQNVRTLPLALFSQVLDPLGMIARGAPMKEAFDTFLRGMREVGRNYKDMFSENPEVRPLDKWEHLALITGTIEAAMFGHHVSEEYSSAFMTPMAKKINDTFFRLNGMESYNRGVRVGATKAAVMFLEFHKNLPSEHSLRWLKELGLSPNDVVLDADGHLITGWRELAATPGWTEQRAKEHMQRVHYAINRWVQGAMITPNAAQRPPWASDPHYSALFHLKQFSYSFHKTILHRAINEARLGNLAPIASFAMFIPAIIAADVTKGLALNAGDLPDHLKGMDLGEWVTYGAGRTGTLGVGNIAMDAYDDVSTLGGPAVEQIVDAMREDIGKTIVKAIPAHALLEPALN